MKVTQEVLKSYARLIVRSGANVRPGQTVLLFIAVGSDGVAELNKDQFIQNYEALIRVCTYAYTTEK